MLRIVKDLARDEAGFIISAELVMIATVCVLGLVVGLTCLRNAVNAEMTEVSCAIRSLDQSYYYTGFHGYKCTPCGPTLKAWTAGSTNMTTEVAEFAPAYELTPSTQPQVIEEHRVEPQPTPAPAPAPLEVPCETIVPAPMMIETVTEAPAPGVPCESAPAICPQPVNTSPCPTIMSPEATCPPNALVAPCTGPQHPVLAVPAQPIW